MILGITGSFGAGKGSVVEYVSTTKHFTHYSASAFIREEIVRRGIVVDRDSMTTVANDLRKKHGACYVIDSLYEQARAHGGDAIIESLRVVAEVRRIKELGGFVLGIDALPKIRYERAYARGSEKDVVSFEKWLEQEQAEINPNDESKQDIFAALKESSVIVSNNGTLAELHQAVDSALAGVL